MILSASGWRKVFTISNQEQDKNPNIGELNTNIAIISAYVYFNYITKVSNQENPVIAVGMDTRPTGPQIADAIIHTLVKKGAIVQFCSVISAPEIMAYSKKLDGFIYVSASHNPIGHNGIKFGTNQGGVLSGTENVKLISEFNSIFSDDSLVQKIVSDSMSASSSEVKNIYTSSDASKFNAKHAYENFINETITGTDNKEYQNDFFGMFNTFISSCPIGIVCDFNGSSRSKSIDKEYFTHKNINFYSINDNQITHEIIPEAENLIYVAKEMENLHKQGHKEVVLGYMPDCDGDRGNIVYWDEKQNKSVILKAQEVFSLSVLAELTYSIWQHEGEKDFKPAVVVNCPTSMRIEEIANTLGATVFRAEVGEANVVNLAREKREQGFNVRILGEGSNGGTITYPSSVRDPLNTIFAIIKLLLMKENGLYEIWCKKSNIEYNPNYTLTDILDSLPVYTTTGVSEERALLHIKNSNHSELKENFQKIFEKEWQGKTKKELEKDYGITNYEAIITNGTKETRNIQNFSDSNKGGLKILLKDKNNKPLCFMWMRGSGTEPVFRIMCDVKGNNPDLELKLCKWLTQMLLEADS